MEVQPKDPSKGHFYVSLAKSAVRVLAGIGLMQGYIVTSGALLIFAELLGVLEEMV